MEEMDPNLKRQIDDILQHSSLPKDPLAKVRAFLVNLGPVSYTRKDFENLADIYLESVEKMPICFWIRIFQAAEKITNPILHTQLCARYDKEKDCCQVGHKNNECDTSCNDYVAEDRDYSNYLECDGSCNSHLGKESHPEEGEDA